LINRVWGSEGGQSRSLDNYIQRIRAKVSKCTDNNASNCVNGKDFIRTVHSVGYAFIDNTGINAT
ncbi:MAG: winged helix-turn-helix domain-containing protein, partial [Cyanobacteria bacterium J06635_15]